jgi:hypothetical protein
MEPLVKFETRLYERDLSRLKELYPIAGPSRVVRKLVRNYLDRIDRLAPQAALELEIELTEEDLATET